MDIVRHIFYSEILTAKLIIFDTFLLINVKIVTTSLCFLSN